MLVLNFKCLFNPIKVSVSPTTPQQHESLRRHIVGNEPFVEFLTQNQIIIKTEKPISAKKETKWKYVLL